MTTMTEIKLIGTTFDTDTNHKKWWEYHQTQQEFTDQITKKNSYQLKPVFNALVEQGVDRIEIPFNGGGDEGCLNHGNRFHQKKNKLIDIDYKKLKPDEFPIKYTPLIHKTPTKTKGKYQCEIFEYQEVNYEEQPDITEDRLIDKFYAFGFLNEWGSFAGEFHVSGIVKIWPKTGKWEMPYSESVENYESHKEKGNMFKEKK